MQNTGNYLNIGNAGFASVRKGTYVDKTGMIAFTNRILGTKDKLICVRRPRRFGKSIAAQMLCAYYDKSCDSRELFERLEISGDASFEQYLNRYNVIYLDITLFISRASNIRDVVPSMKAAVMKEVADAFPDVPKGADLAETLINTAKTIGEKFIMIIDEWDALFREARGDAKLQKEYIVLLRSLFKSSWTDAVFEAVYITGILPIKKYSTGSALNMFKEYTMLRDPFFEEYFGFTENEVKALCERQSALTMDEISDWYNGYQAGGGTRLYNPRSVVCALEDSMCQSYWTRTGKMDEVLFFLKYNIGEVRDDVIRLVNDIPVRIDIKKEYYAGQKSPANRKDIYSAMIIYGLLSYHDGELRIPNKELMLEFEEALEDDDFGYVAELVRNSDQILNATLEKKGDTVASYLHDIHNSELPILKYNDENSLSCVVTLAYLSARNKYRIEREEKSGKGFADFIFHPRRNNLPGIILELKADSTPQDAIAQIKNKEYCEKLRKENVTNILAVGLSYDTGKKEHLCTITDLS